MQNGVGQAGGTGGAMWRNALHGRARALLLVVGTAACLTVVGCAAQQKNQPPDPLLGTRTPPPGTIAGGPTTPPPAPSPVAMPAPSVPSSTAVLASGPARPLDSGMRIGGDPGAVPPPPAPSNPGWGMPVLQNPEPAAGSMARSAPGPVASPHAAAGSYEQAQDVLRSRGVTWQRLETWGDKGEWKFTCSIPNKQNPAISRNYEARASTPIDAIHAVLEKLDKEP
jgi:hypothetical protein